MKYSTIIILALFLVQCKPSKDTVKTHSFKGIAPVLVYKTRADYFNNVPIQLSDDKATIVSYPSPADLKKNQTFSTPTKLNNGYWLDNRGIGLNTAFLKLTYSQYATLPVAPSLEQLKELILDDNPFLELYHCGDKSDFQSLEKELNKHINNKTLKQFQRLK